MIFVSVGTQLPFERLIKAMDEWASENTEVGVFAQIGATKYRPNTMSFKEKLTPIEYQNYFARADIIVSHAGMGTIITGLEHAKPMVLMPRRFKFGEHRNDHQVGTAERFEKFDLINIVENEESLFERVNHCLRDDARENLAGGVNTSETLIDRIHQFINEKLHP